MENKFFRPAGNLNEEKSDLIYSKTVTPEVAFFRNPGDIEMDSRHFKVAGDLDRNENNVSINNGDLSLKGIDDYLLTVVSGKKYDSVCELGVLMGAGRMVVDLEQLKRMVDEGHNIVSAKVINASRGLIEIEFQKYEYDQELIEKRRRF